MDSRRGIDHVFIGQQFLRRILVSQGRVAALAVFFEWEGDQASGGQDQDYGAASASRGWIRSTIEEPTPEGIPDHHVVAEKAQRCDTEHSQMETGSKTGSGSSPTNAHTNPHRGR